MFLMYVSVLRGHLTMVILFVFKLILEYFEYAKYDYIHRDANNKNENKHFYLPREDCDF